MLQDFIQATEAFDENLFVHAEAQTEMIGDSKKTPGCDSSVLLQQLGNERVDRALFQVNEANRTRIRRRPRELGVSGQEILDEQPVLSQTLFQGDQDVVGVISGPERPFARSGKGL